MKKHTAHTVMRVIRILTACVAILMLQSCGSDEADKVPADGPEETIQVGFRMRVDSRYGSSKSRMPADYDDPSKYVPVAGYENYIGLDKYDYRFLLFDGEGRYHQTLAVLTIGESDAGAGYTDYNVLCVMNGKTEGQFRIVALANWGVDGYPAEPTLRKGVTTIADVCSYAGGIYSYSPASDGTFTPSADTPIPMYGVKTCDVDLKPNVQNHVGTIYLLLAMARIEVECDPANESALELASVKLAGYSTRGYCAPEGMADNTDYVTAAHIPSGAANSGELDFTISTDKRKAVIYVPEYRNTSPAASPCRLLVAFADNPARVYTVEFKEYVGGRPSATQLDVLRNMLYRFTVNKTYTGFEVEVEPYTPWTLDPEFGLGVATNNRTR